jgi:hypothetical protein
MGNRRPASTLDGALLKRPARLQAAGDHSLAQPVASPVGRASSQVLEERDYAGNPAVHGVTGSRWISDDPDDNQYHYRDT